MNLTFVLGLFGMITRLLVNFHKSTVIGVYTNDQMIHNEVNFLGCKVESFPFRYLGLPLTGKGLKVHDWNPW